MNNVNGIVPNTMGRVATGVTRFVRLGHIGTLVLIMGLGPALSATTQTDLPVDSEIKQVTVFLNRAQVVREVKTRLATGETNLVVGGLTAGLDPQSIQVSGAGSIIIMGIQHNQNYLDEANLPARLKVLQDSLEYYLAMVTEAQNQKAILAKEEQLMEANQKIGGTQQNLTVAELKAMADFFRSRMTDIGVTKINVDKKIKELNEKVVKLRQQIEEQRGFFARNTSEIVISVSSKTATSATLEISYIVSNAGWYPVYDLRATDTKSPIELNYKANVFQQTGEVWENVKLKLSTANPALGGQKPELYTWYLDFPRPMPLAGKAPGVMIRGNKSLRQEVDAATEIEAVADAETLSNYVSTIQTSLNTEFDISLPYTVASTPKPTVVDVARHQVEATYRYAATPKLDADAFLLAKATGWEEYSLLPGEANVFFEGTFVGKSYIDPGSVKDTLSFSLGRDKRIVVQREKVRDFTSRRTIGSNQRDRYTWEISVRNTRNEPVKITVEDHVPVSKNSQIEVTVDNTGGASYTAEDGKLVWDLSLNPNETKKLRYSFEVKYPKDQVIPGLE